nr:DNA-directed RNA polymerases IV and V subunit 4-like [Ipomoea batatas]
MLDSLDGSFMKSNGKADKPVGEGDKVEKSGKGQTAKAPTPLELRVEQGLLMCLIANLRLESVDEVFALVPSLKGKKNKVEEPLKNVLEELAKLKKSS